MKNIDKVDLAKLAQEVFNVADYLSSNEKHLPAAARLIRAAETVWDEQYDGADGDAIIRELLNRNFEYDYKDYSYYVSPEDLKYCDLACALYAMREIYSTVNEYLASDIDESFLAD